MDGKLERRSFVKLLAGSGVAGTALLQACLAEAAEEGALAPETVEALLAFTGQTPPEDMDELVSSLEGHLENIRVVRDWSVPRELEPALKFRAGHPAPRPGVTAPVGRG